MTCGSACNVPPTAACVAGAVRTYATQGACISGQCQYGHADVGCAYGCTGSSCNADPCAQVTCTPPGNLCESSTVARVFAASGQCSAGNCAFPYSEVSCAFGCSNGACSAPSCNGQTCGAVPASTCVDSSTRRQYEVASACDAGSCSYPSMDSYCSNGCLNGSCLNGSDESFFIPHMADDVAIDSTGLSHLVGCDGTNVTYQWLAEGNFGLETVPMSTNCASSNAHIAVTPTGMPVVIWYETTNQDLRYAERTGPNQWTVEIIANAGDVGSSSALMVDSAGTRWALWIDKTRHQVRAGKRTAPNTWTDTLVVNSDYLYPRLALTPGVDGIPNAVVSEGEQGSDAGVRGDLLRWNGTSWAEVDHIPGIATQAHVSPAHQLQLIWEDPTTANSTLRTYSDAGIQDESLPQAYYLGPISNLSAGAALCVDAFDTGAYFVRYDGEWVKKTFVLPSIPNTESFGPFVAIDAPDRRMRELNQFEDTPAYTVTAACVPSCDNRVCGDDGCGGQCGTCTGGQLCAQGQCGPWEVETVTVQPHYSSWEFIARGTPTGLVALDLNTEAQFLYTFDGQWSKSPLPFQGYAVHDSMQVDASGRLFVAWTEPATHALHLGRHDATGWTQTDINTSATSFSNGMALDAAGDAHVVYAPTPVSGNSGPLKYATVHNGIVTTQDIMTLPYATPDAILYSSVVVDSAGRAHVVIEYNPDPTQENWNVAYATNTSGSWGVTNLRTAEYGLSAGPPPQMLLGTGDTIYLALQDGNSTFTFGTHTPGNAWQLETVPGITYVHVFALVLLPQGPALIHAVDTTRTSTLLLRVRSGAGSWSSENVPQSAAQFDFGVDGTGTLQGFLISSSSNGYRHARRF